MTKSALKKYAPWVAGAGVLGLLVAGVAYFIQREFSQVVQISLVVGLLGLVVAALINPEAIAQAMAGRQARYSANTLVMVLALLGILVLMNYLAYNNRASLRRDLSEGQVNTLAPETLEALKTLPEPVKAIGFYTSQASFQQESAQEILDRLKIEGQGKFGYEFVDPDRDPARASQYGLTKDATVYLEMGSQRQELSFVSEAELASALVRFNQPIKRAVYFLTGHGERDTAQTDENGISSIADKLKEQNYDIKPLNLQVTNTVPSDARVIVVAGSLQPLTQSEVDTLGRYLQTEDASLVALLDPPAQSQGDEPPAADPLVDYLKNTWGITARTDIIVDVANSFPQQPLIPLNNGYASSPITDRLQGVATFFPLARSLEYTTTTDVTVTPLITTDEGAWGETDIASLQSQSGPAADDAEATGPLTLALSAVNNVTKSRVVVFGDSDFAGNGFSNQGANAALLTNSVNWASRDETLINLTPRTPTTRTLEVLNALSVNVILLFTVLVMPLGVLAMGVVVWFLRREKVQKEAA